MVNRMKIHMDAAKSNGIFGEDDPVSLAFASRIKKYVWRMMRYIVG